MAKSTTNKATLNDAAKDTTEDGKSKALGLALETIEKQFGKMPGTMKFTAATRWQTACGQCQVVV